MKRKVQLLLACVMLLFCCCVSSQILPSGTVKAAKQKLTGWQKDGEYYRYYSKAGKMYTGWKTVGGKRYYFRKKSSERGPKGARVTGLAAIGKRTFLFSETGELQTGWKQIGDKIYYFAPSGKAGKIGAMYTGMHQIGVERFLFQPDGTLTTGWQTIGGNKYYFSTSKVLGTRGRLLTNGWWKLFGYYYYFTADGVLKTNCWIDDTYYVNEKGRRVKSTITPDGYIVDADGVRKSVANGWVKASNKFYYYNHGKKLTGWQTINNKRYYFSAAGVRQTGWQTISGKNYYFNSKGVMKKGWLTLNGKKYFLKKGVLVYGWQTINGKRYYFDTDGVMQSGWIQINGDKYYLKDGIMQTGWQIISDKRYYLGTDGKMAVNTVIDGYEIDANGVAKRAGNKAHILLIAGHGAGDVGAQGTFGKTTYYESILTREFSTLIQKKLAALGPDVVEAVMYDQNYDCYQVNAGIKAGPLPVWTDYDYVLEVHFNATAQSGKDPNGDGKFKGVGIYVNSAKTKIELDRSIVNAVGNTGFRVWASGVERSSGLLNAKVCQAKGVSYGLLETAFIDDKDDMDFYLKNKDKMASAVASAIVSFFK